MEISFNAGDKVPQSGNYTCELCNVEGGEVGQFLQAGEEFPECGTCGSGSTWHPVEEQAPVSPRTCA